jgi:carbon storage regulator CsrA
MLVITRREGEQITIGDRDVVITIVRVRGKRVRVGITAAKEIRVTRHKAVPATAISPG